MITRFQALPLLALAPAMLVARPADAQAAASVELTWQVPAGQGCVSVDELASAVARLLGRDVFAGEGEPTLRVAARAIRGPDARGWGVTVEVRSGTGEELGQRELESRSDDCRALDEPLELVIALIIDPDAVQIGGASEPAPVPVPEPAPEPIAEPEPLRGAVQREVPPEPAPPLEPEPLAGLSWWLGVRLSGTAGVNLHPGVALGGEAAVSLAPADVVDIELSASAWSSGVARQGPGEVDLWTWSVGLSGCPTLWRSSTLRWAGCAGGHARWVHASPTGFDVNTPQTEAVFDVSLGSRVAVRVNDWLSIGAHLTAWIHTNPPRFFYEDVGRGERVTVYELPVVSGSLGVDLLGRWQL